MEIDMENICPVDNAQQGGSRDRNRRVMSTRGIRVRELKRRALEFCRG